MSPPPFIREVFGRFQNLNLLALLHDLRGNAVARQAWSARGLLCPVAHGLAAGRQVQELNVLGQAADLEDGCDFAARQLGADPAAVFRFVRSWDEEALGRDWLYGQLQELWHERLADAVAMQEVLQGAEDEPAEDGGAAVNLLHCPDWAGAGPASTGPDASGYSSP
jgi:hypothetical protein